jgi:hypothetical protein
LVVETTLARAPTASTRNGNGVILTPNHRVTFFADNRLFVTSLVDSPTLQSVSAPVPLAKLLNFYYDVPLATALTQLETAYGIDIEVDKKNLASCPLTADQRHTFFLPAPARRHYQGAGVLRLGPDRLDVRD